MIYIRSVSRCLCFVFAALLSAAYVKEAPGWEASMYAACIGVFGVFGWNDC